ncbi:pyridine nucleotide-disulfide oxidoreductase-domain-containing protein [Hypoxylon sp. FL1857]|nr:pyridine nucleotide-disulfide oxidoreductase-domain-containing protein [Hypoxylon sp. FL1857]
MAHHNCMTDATLDPSSCTSERHSTAVVVGGGASGIAALGNLLEVLGTDASVAWVDPHFQGGRINAKYREVPSNTKVCHFLAYVHAVKSFREIAQSASKPNAVTVLQNLPQDDTCSLHHAGDMLQMLSDGLLKDNRVSSWTGTVTDAEWDATESAWFLTIQDGAGNVIQCLRTPLVVYCTGASPTVVPLPTDISRVPELLELDIFLKPSLLPGVLPRDRDVCVGVIGASHSAVLVLMNLFTLSRNSHPLLRVRWFSRAKRLKYAEDRGDWILYDNTGLKGCAAQFAREHLDGERLLHSDVGKIVARVDCSGGPEQEAQAMRREIPGCDYVVQAVGFSTKALPIRQQNISFDHQTGDFIDQTTSSPIPGLHGAGIGFPERVVDPLGNVEYSVGFIKFMRFLERVVPKWVQASPK